MRPPRSCGKGTSSGCTTGISRPPWRRTARSCSTTPPPRRPRSRGCGARRSACCSSSTTPLRWRTSSLSGDSIPDSPRAMEGRWVNAFALLAQAKYAEADREFRKILSRVSDRRDAARARWGMAQAMEGEGNLEGALAVYEAMREDWEDPEYVAEKVERLKKRLSAR